MNCKKVTSKVLAEKVGTSLNVITRLRDGKLEPSLELAIHISKILECDVKDIFNYY